MKQLENQIAVVTGAGRGIGRAIALKLAAHGADIVAVDLKTEFVQETVDEVRKLGRKAWAVAANVSEAASVEAAAEQILKEPGRVDILVNNAGITKDGLLMRMSEADWDAVLDINLKGTFLFTRELCRSLLKQRSGRIVNIASVIGLIGNAGQVQLRGQQGRGHRAYQIRAPASSPAGASPPTPLRRVSSRRR